MSSWLPVMVGASPGLASRARAPTVLATVGDKHHKGSGHMGEILGLGCTHYPGLLQPDEKLPGGFRHLLTAPNVPASYKDRANWPGELLTELGNDAGASSARRYGARMADDFRAVRKALDEFNPDLVLIWG